MHAIQETHPDTSDRRTGADGDWLSTLFRDHHRRVLNAAYRVTGSSADAEDVLQTVFSRLAARAPERVPSWGAYLQRAAVNASLDVLRARKRTRASDVDEIELPDAGPGADASARLGELEARLRAALAQESPRAAEMFALRCFEDHGYQEIADAYGTSRSVVAVTLFRVRQRLKRQLGDQR